MLEIPDLGRADFYRARATTAPVRNRLRMPTAGGTSSGQEGPGITGDRSKALILNHKTGGVKNPELCG